MLFSIIGLITATCEIIKEKCQPTIPAENWANKDLYYKDMANGVTPKQLSKNLANGKYKINGSYPEPHKDSRTGKVIIENDKLYKEDVKNYGVLKAREWMYQGKYNLTPDELKKREEEIKKEWEYLYSLLK